MSKLPPAFNRDQLVAWLHFLGKKEDDKDDSDSAEDHEKTFYDQERLRNGKTWPRLPNDYYRGYLPRGRTGILFYDGFDISSAAQGLSPLHQHRGGYFQQHDTDTSSMPRQDTPSNFKFRHAAAHPVR